MCGARGTIAGVDRLTVITGVRSIKPHTIRVLYTYHSPYTAAFNTPRTVDATGSTDSSRLKLLCLLSRAVSLLKVLEPFGSFGQPKPRDQAHDEAWHERVELDGHAEPHAHSAWAVGHRLHSPVPR